MHAHALFLFRPSTITVSRPLPTTGPHTTALLEVRAHVLYLFDHPTLSLPHTFPPMPTHMTTRLWACSYTLTKLLPHLLPPSRTYLPRPLHLGIPFHQHFQSFSPPFPLSFIAPHPHSHWYTLPQHTYSYSRILRKNPWVHRVTLTLIATECILPIFFPDFSCSFQQGPIHTSRAALVLVNLEPVIEVRYHHSLEL